MPIVLKNHDIVIVVPSQVIIIGDITFTNLETSCTESLTGARSKHG